jgi:hypothetical protein
MWSFNSSPPSKQNPKKKKRRKATCKKAVLLWVSRSMFWTSIHKLKTKKHDTSSSTKETCYEILTGEQLFFSSHHNHKKKKKKKRKEERKKSGCFFAAPIFWLWWQAWNNLSFDHLKKQVVLRLKNQTKSEQKI